MVSILQNTEGCHGNTLTQVKWLQYVIKTYSNGHLKHYAIRCMTAFSCQVCPVRTQEKIPTERKKGFLNHTQTIKLAGMESASGKKNQTVVNRIYDRQSGLRHRAIHKAATVHL